MSDEANEPMTSPPDTRVVRLESNEGELVELTMEAAKLSSLVVDTLGEEEGDDLSPVTVPKADTATLKLLVEYMKYYPSRPMDPIEHPITGGTLEEVIKQEWYQKFIMRPEEDQIYKMLLAANFMHIQPLLDLLVIRITFIFHGKTEQELKDLLNFPDLTSEEEAQARRDHPWIFEDSGAAAAES